MGPQGRKFITSLSSMTTTSFTTDEDITSGATAVWQYLYVAVFRQLGRQLSACVNVDRSVPPVTGPRAEGGGAVPPTSVSQ